MTTTNNNNNNERTTLRDEIRYWINDHCEGNETGLYGIDEAADDIIKAIERRIDSMIKLAYEKDPVSVWPLRQVMEMLKE